MVDSDPADADWTQMDDATVRELTIAGIPEALAEATRRGIYEGEPNVYWPDESDAEVERGASVGFLGALAEAGRRSFGSEGMPPPPRPEPEAADRPR